MGTLRVVCFALLVCGSLAQVENEYQPMVAFKCNYPAMYLTEKGWIKDDDSDCVDDVEDVLEYCKKIFPTQDVRNVVESGQMYTINGWCNVGESSCEQSFTVRPYRCLVGPFQSDALLVPAGCTFDHEHRSHECKTFGEWNATAVQRCTQQDRVAQSFAVLQPCEDTVSRFDGVEFVCCPKNTQVAPVKKVDKQASQPTESSSEEESEMTNQKGSADSNNAYYSYVHSLQDPTDLKEEHAQFVQAKSELQRQHQSAVSLLEEDWKRVTERVQRMKETDPQGAEKLEREATARFQKTSKALEDDGHSDKRQLDTIHQRRVDTILASLRSDALDSYHQALSEHTQDTEKILTTLKRYIKREQKERQHVENRYHHLLQSDPEQLAVEKHQMADKLRTISLRIKEAIDQLDQVTDDQQKLRQQIDDYMQTFSQLDRSAALILNEDAIEPEASISVNAPSNADDSSSSTVKEDEEPAIPAKVEQSEEQPLTNTISNQPVDQKAAEPSNNYELADGSVDDHSSDTNSEEVSTNQLQEAQEQKPAATVTNENEGLSDESDDDDDESDAEEVVRNNGDDGNDTPQIKHSGDLFNNDEIELNEAKPFRLSEHDSRHMSAGAVIGTVGGCMAIVALVIAAVIMLHRRINQTPRHGPAFSSVPQSMSPEDHHVVSMQMTGYENPTYRYFEDGGSSKA